MEDVQTIAVLMYLAGVVGCAIAGDKRTIGGFGGVLLGLFCTPLVGALLLLSWPSREEVAYYHFLRKQSDVSQK